MILAFARDLKTWVNGYSTAGGLGGPGVEYTLFSWALGENDEGNLAVTAPSVGVEGERGTILASWELPAGDKYMGGISLDIRCFSRTRLSIDTD